MKIPSGMIRISQFWQTDQRASSPRTGFVVWNLGANLMGGQSLHTLSSFQNGIVYVDVVYVDFH